MAGTPPVGPGQLSPDGTWRWDGVQWVRNQPQRNSARRSRRWLWVVAACITVLLLSGLGVGYWAYSWVQGFIHGSNTCLPADFPRYPGSVYADETFELGGPYPGITCHVVLESNDDVAAVTAFYQDKLNTGAWRVTPRDEEFGRVEFQPARGTTPFGTVQVAAGSVHTEITIDTFTATCLPLNFPLYPGARFGGQQENADRAIGGCHIVFVSNDRVASVTSFYERALNSGYWHVDSSSGGKVSWRLIHGKRTDASGTVMISVGGDRTVITIDSRP